MPGQDPAVQGRLRPGGRLILIRTAFLLLILAATPALAETAAMDTTVTHLDDLVVQGQEAPTTQPDRMRLEAPVIQVQDPASLADIGGLIPSARVATNSRGDSHLMIRGAPERHVQTFLDDIPLNLPWDERVDLRTVPITGSATLAGTRGLTTLLDGPGVLAGSMRILPPSGYPLEPTTRLGLNLGEMGRTRADVQHRRSAGSWDLTGAAAWQSQDGWPVPDTGDMRFNSDLEQFSLLLRGSRPVKTVGRLNLMATAWSAELGVPPETNLGDEARFWRYPVRKRALAGASIDMPLGDGHTWDLKAALSADYFEQEIDPRGPDGWDDPLVTGEDYEWDRDRTGYGNARLTRWLGDTARLDLQATARYTHHSEILTVGGPTEDYSQWLTSLTAESEFALKKRLTLRLGLGWDYAATPESGDKPANDPEGAPAYNIRLIKETGATARLFAAASRRSRFPSLRELYSGALGRFVPNPDLQPEVQDLFEVGYAAAPGAWQLEAGVFLNYLHDGIEKVALNNPEKQFMRVNQSEIRVPGLELVARYAMHRDLRVLAQYTYMDAQVKDENGYDQPAEDRPDYLARAGFDWQRPTGPGALFEAIVTGPRWSADSSGNSADTDGLAHLPAGVTWNLRLSYRLVHPQTTIDFHVRADNLFDQSVPYQVGLTNPGRVFSAGAAIDF